MVGAGKTKKQTFEQEKMSRQNIYETQRKKFMHEQRQIRNYGLRGSQDGGQTLQPLAKFFT